MKKALWLAAGVVVVVLAVMTVRLARLAADDEIRVGMRLYLSGRDALVFLREEPRSRAPVAATVEQGTVVQVSEIAVSSTRKWFLVETPAGRGWVPRDRLSLTPP